MAELTISADEIRSAIQNYVTEYTPRRLPRGGRHRHRGR